ncbi:hypothetical protein L226DRAFT_535445 [Lentinus tigrinus ALCF2SS1-7]|uniref:Uncharacterized protein n=1 Tax=Lentinus tigrinus ALCF2SS1-6 TaxID=1328759 RepID=A0A5C2SFJ2_9APHY|nr:hypothetical protein L227DRAFT_573940 [Lentinus tigrinus ALCF2SS1-6]RPD74566.1 hypothetical protein L226DRAFT_535445 [Lentinus tigrinus ALCF2SS1-7]
MVGKVPSRVFAAPARRRRRLLSWPRPPPAPPHVCTGIARQQPVSDAVPAVPVVPRPRLDENSQLGPTSRRVIESRSRFVLPFCPAHCQRRRFGIRLSRPSTFPPAVGLAASDCQPFSPPCTQPVRPALPSEPSSPSPTPCPQSILFP